MPKTLLTLTLGLLLAGCGADPNHAWHLQQPSDKGTYQATLSCASAPIPGAFQECKLTLQGAQAVPANLLVAVDGGMPAHGHGLPTAPQAIPTDTNGTYRIDGLKFSMPGEWVLGFLLDNGTQPEKVVFRFSL